MGVSIQPFLDAAQAGNKSHDDREGVTTRATSEAITASARVSGLAPPKVKHGLKDGPTGIPSVDHGFVCDRVAQSETCFLTKDQRTDIIPHWIGRVVAAETHYLTALQELRVEELLKKESDNTWLVSLILDVAGAHVVSMIASRLVSLRSQALERLTNSMVASAMAGDEISKTRDRAHALLQRVSEKNLGSGVKHAIDFGRKKYAAALPKSGDTSEGKASNVAMLDSLTRQATSGFEAIRDTAPGLLNDADFIVLFESFAAENHTVDEYKAGLSAKLARFNSSGVTKIGRTNALHSFHVGDSEEAVKLDVLRDTQLVWLRYPDGRMELRYQTQDGSIDPSVAHAGDPGTRWLKSQPAFGPHRPIEDEAQLGGIVPVEFVDAALARHTSFWGTVPITIYARDPKSWFFRDRTPASPATPEPMTAGRQHLPTPSTEPKWSSNKF